MRNSGRRWHDTRQRRATGVDTPLALHQGHSCHAIRPNVANHAAISIQRIMVVMLSINVSRKGFGIATCKLAIAA